MLFDPFRSHLFHPYSLLFAIKIFIHFSMPFLLPVNAK